MLSKLGYTNIYDIKAPQILCRKFLIVQQASGIVVYPQASERDLGVSTFIRSFSFGLQGKETQ